MVNKALLFLVSRHQVLIHYRDADDCSKAHRALTGLVLKERTVITSYFPTGKLSIPGIFSPVVRNEKQGCNTERTGDEIRKRSLSDLHTDGYGKCMKID